jgi:uncharacterized membrane protein YphA (DoxX/SURF4 family)
MKRKVIIEIIAFLFIALFIYAGVSKVLDYEKFSVQVGQSPLLTGFGGVIPWLVILVELLISMCIMVPRLRLFAFLCAFSLMVMFTAYIIAILNFSPYVPCSCGGILEKFTWSDHLILNCFFVMLALLAIVLQAEENSGYSDEKQSAAL